MKSRAFVFALLVTLLVFSLVFAAGEKIPWWSVNGGGNILSSSTNYKACGSVAQPATAEAMGTNYCSYAGLWSPWIVGEAPYAEDEPILPEDFSISQNYPNPFNPHTVIEYALPQKSHVKIVVYNLMGQKVRVLRDEVEQAGYKRVMWDGEDETGSEVASGIYFYRIEAKDLVKCKKMILLK